MSDDLNVPVGERGRLRVFAVNLAAEEVRPLTAPADPDRPDPVSRPTAEAATSLLGIPGLDPAGLELFAVKDLEGVGLPAYLTDGHGITQADIASDRARLAALDGYVLVALSDAFPAKPAEITPGATLTLIGTYGQPATDWTSAPIETASAAPYSAPKITPRDRRQQAVRTGARIFAVVMTLLTLLVLWLVFG